MGAWYIKSEKVLAQISDPGAVGAGTIWCDTDANLVYRRNDANNDWNIVGSDTTVSATEYGYLNGLTGSAIGNISTQRIGFAASFTTTAAAYVDITGLTVTIPNRTGIKALVTADIRWQTNTASNITYFRFVNNAVNEGGIGITPNVTNDLLQNTIVTNNSTANTIVKVQTGNTGGVATVTVYGTTAGNDSHITTLEASP